MQVKIEDEEFKEAKWLIFDKGDKYVTLASSDQVIVFSLMKDSTGEMIQNYTIDSEKYSQIYDIIFDSGLDLKDYQ